MIDWDYKGEQATRSTKTVLALIVNGLGDRDQSEAIYKGNHVVILSFS